MAESGIAGPAFGVASGKEAKKEARAMRERHPRCHLPGLFFCRPACTRSDAGDHASPDPPFAEQGLLGWSRLRSLGVRREMLCMRPWGKYLGETRLRRLFQLYAHSMTLKLYGGGTMYLASFSSKVAAPYLSVPMLAFT